MTKGLRYLGNDKDGKDILEEYESTELPAIKPDYAQLVVEAIRKKYSENDEQGVANNRMLAWDDEIRICKGEAPILSDAKRMEYNEEYVAFQKFRQECKEQARKIVEQKG